MKRLIDFLLSPVPTNAFRNDINALRAWAVLSVVFYHFSIRGFSGGFVGVDVFFVISGFLMTGIIVKGLEGQKFSLLDFYFARIRRILPGLTGLSIAVIAIGWFLLAPDDYVKMAEHVQDALVFTSNNTFRKESGYFDALSHDKWMLHTWSLSVEWQFYIILPFIVWISWVIGKSRKIVCGVLACIALISLVSCILKTESDAAKAFYMLKYRCWEMVFGGIVYFFDAWKKTSEKSHKISFYIGGGLILWSVIFINSGDAWPGYLAIVPVLGASLYIYASSSAAIINNLSFVQWIGYRSYSIYLWHWPIVVLLAYYQKSNSFFWVFMGLIVSLLLGGISYRFIEEPARNGSKKKNNYALFVILLAVVAVFSLAKHVVSAAGIPARVNEDVLRVASEQNNAAKGARDCIFDKDKKMGPLSCVYGEGAARAIVIGDSHASALVTAVQVAAGEVDNKVYIWSRAACPLVRGVVAKIGQDCDAFVGWVFGHLKHEPNNIPVVLIERSSLYAFGSNEGRIGNKIPSPPVYFDKPHDSPDPVFLKELRERSIATICELSEGRKVYLVRPIPEMKVSVPQIMARYKMQQVEKRVSLSLTEYYARHKFVFDLQDEAKIRCGVEILDPLPYLCDKDYCYGDLNGRPLYFDDDHLSEFGNKVLVPMFSRIFITK
jgi:peptidoglycan/LPS O-acetylase OafA/YrhL